MLEALLNLALPPRCGGCQAPGSLFCSSCVARIRPLNPPLCPRCGVEVEFERSSCPCRTRLRAIGRLRSAGLYEGPLERAIHRFKYEGRRPLAGPLSRLLLDHVTGAGVAAGLLVAVPLHPSRLRDRGYNQAELLVAELRRSLRLPKPPGRLVRVRDTPPQVGLDRLRRLRNMRAAFSWTGKDLCGQPVIVVDDVTTTGATLDACAVALRLAGASSVTGLTLARVGL